MRWQMCISACLLCAMLAVSFAAGEEVSPTTSPALNALEPAVPDPPSWAVQYTDGLRAWKEIIQYWIDNQRDDGTFGFGLGEDCEMTVGWPGVMMAADDQEIATSLDRMCDSVWYNATIQGGYLWQATDPEHGAEPTSYTNPIMFYQRFGSPKYIERLMTSAKNVEHWTDLTPRGDRHMRSTYFGSQQHYDWPFYAEDSPINARAWLPMQYVLMYNRDPHLMKYFLEWTGAWAKHAMADVYGKPPGILPGTVEFNTGEPGGYTNNWWGAGAHDFSSLWYQTRLHGMLVQSYLYTGDSKYITPLRELLRFLSTYAKPRVENDTPLPPDIIPEQFILPDGWRDGTQSTRWARDVAKGHLGGWYYYVTGDTQFDDAFAKILGEPVRRGGFDRIDKDIVAHASRRAVSMRDTYFTKTLESVKHGGSTANYAAAWWQKGYGTMTFGPRCFHDGGRLANAVNWPWVDFPPPAVAWKNTGYTTGIFVLEDSPTLFRANLANLAATERTIGAQLFTLDEGDYRLRFGLDTDEDGQFDAVTRTDRVKIRRGTVVDVTLPVHVTTLLEIERDPDSAPAPAWQPLPDLAIDPRDVMVSTENPQAGEQIELIVRVHNIGSAAAEQVSIEIRNQDGKPIVDGKLDLIKPPHELTPSFINVPLPVTLTEGLVGVRVVLDSKDAIREIYEGNNTVEVKLANCRTGQRVKEFVQHPPAKKPSLEDVTADNLSRYDVPYRKGITLDGKLAEAAWQAAPPFELIPHDGETPVKKKTQMRLLYDNDAFYVGVVCDEPDPQWLDSDLKDRHQIYYKDGFEIFVDPGAQIWRYWQFVFDVAEHQFQTLTRNEYAEQAPWEVAVDVGERQYSAEARFPFDSFDVPPPKPGDRWRLNVCRYTTTFRDPDTPQRKLSERSHFSPMGSLHSYHQPRLFGDIYFGPRED